MTEHETLAAKLLNEIDAHFYSEAEWLAAVRRLARELSDHGVASVGKDKELSSPHSTRVNLALV